MLECHTVLTVFKGIDGQIAIKIKCNKTEVIVGVLGLYLSPDSYRYGQDAEGFFNQASALWQDLSDCDLIIGELVPDKTKLLCFTPRGMETTAFYWKLVSPVSLGPTKIPFSNEAEHVGILRSVDGNLPNVMSRISAHTRALNVVLPVGLARGHRGNPAAALRIERLNGLSVLLSGLPALVLSNPEISTLHQFYKVNLERLQKLHRATPEAVVCFLGGCLPLTAILHLRQLSLLIMIAHLGSNNILHQHGSSILTADNPPPKSWFVQVRNICTKYSLQDPLLLLSSPPSKSSFKRKAKALITDFWETQLRADAAPLDSLVFFKTNFYSLSKPHPIWLTAGNNPYEVEKACIQARMLSGRYRTCWLSRHWSGNSSGFCSLPLCSQTSQTPGTLLHILTECEDLSQARLRIFSLWRNFLQDKPALFPIIQKYTLESEPTLYLQFILDCSVLPDIISATQHQQTGPAVLDSLFYLTRTLCFSIHKARLKLLGKWNIK